MTVITSNRRPEEAVYRHVIPTGEPQLFEVKRRQTLRLLGLENNQVIDALFYNADNPRGYYDAQRTLHRQGNAYLTTGGALYSNLDHPLMTTVAGTCGRHDILGGACAQESSAVRYAFDKRYMHSCRGNFLCACLHDSRLHRHDIGANINFFMNVPVTPEDDLAFADDISATGKYIKLRAEYNAMVLISNCPQLNNPCNGWDPTPAEVLVWN